VLFSRPSAISESYFAWLTKAPSPAVSIPARFHSDIARLTMLVMVSRSDARDAGALRASLGLYLLSG
jgi:hypothetical protein